MSFTYNYSIPLYDIEQLFVYLKEKMPSVVSLTDVNPLDVTLQYITDIPITIYTNNELSQEDKTNLDTIIANYTNPITEPVVTAFRKISSINSTNIPLYPGAQFTGQWEDVSNYSTVTIFVACDAPSATNGLEIHYSTDAVHDDYVKYLTVTSVGSRTQITVSCCYFKLNYTNGSVFSNLRIQALYHTYRNKPIGTNISQPVDDSFDCEVVRSVINGRLENGTYTPVNTTTDGEMRVAITSPITSFGEISTAQNCPVIQHDFVYEINPNCFQVYEQNGGTVRQANGMAVCTTAGYTNNSATIRSRRVLRYHAGQGCMGRFTAKYDQPQSGNVQIVGFGNPESGMFIGYENTTFGILYVSANIRELWQITVNETSNDSQEITVVLGGVPYTVPVTAGTNQAVTAWDIASHDYTTSVPGWVMSAIGSTIYVGCLCAGAIQDDFSISFPVSGQADITKLWSGSSATTVFIPQNDFNIDVMDGTGSTSNPSGALINPQNGNLYYVKFQYLGFGYMEFGIEDPTSTNTIPIHRIFYANRNASPNLSNPTLPFVVSSRNTTCNNSISVSSASCVGVIQGTVKNLGTLTSYTNYNTNISTVPTHIFTVRSMFIYKNRFNLVNIVPIMLNVCNFGDTFVQLDIIRYGTSDNNANFQNQDENSVAEFDTSAMTITGGQIKYSTGVCPGQNMTINLKELDIVIEQNTTLSLVANTLSGTASMSCSLTYAED